LLLEHSFKENCQKFTAQVLRCVYIFAKKISTEFYQFEFLTKNYYEDMDTTLERKYSELL